MDPLYDACGNRVTIHHNHEANSLTQLRTNTESLLHLAQDGIARNVDSVMVLTGDPNQHDHQGYHVTMDVFEPNAFSQDNLSAGWSTMCGNGVRAVAQYIADTTELTPPFFIQTRSGVQRVDRVDDLWSVNMGAFTQDQSHLAQYVSHYPSSIDEFNIADTDRFESQPHIGFHYQPSAESVDGEPHLVLFTQQEESLASVQALANQVGTIVTATADFFPEEINTSVASIQRKDTSAKTVSVNAATYERNIYYVTKACGTAATVIGSLVFEHEDLDDDWQVEITMPGGVLVITRKDENYFLTGPAYKE